MVSGKTFGITFRYNDSNNNYLFVYTPDTGIRFLKRADNKLDINQTIADYTLEAGKTYRFKVVVQGNHFTCYIDGGEIFDITDDSGSVPALATGPCGLYTSGMTADYDNITIKSSVTALPHCSERHGPER